MMRLVLGVAGVLACGAALAAPIRFELPEETATFAPGPGLEVAQTNCAGCHSADYIGTQPRGLADPKAFWAAEVTKMRNVYKAQIADVDVPEIVAYLAATYGK